MKPAQQKALNWLANGETGTSSKTMAFWLAFSIKMDDGNHPLDPADFDRCLRLLEWVPELRPQISQMSLLGRHWSALIASWDAVEQCHLQEVGLGWSKARIAPLTYDLMQQVYAPVDGRRRAQR